MVSHLGRPEFEQSVLLSGHPIGTGYGDLNSSESLAFGGVNEDIGADVQVGVSDDRLA